MVQRNKAIKTKTCPNHIIYATALLIIVGFACKLSFKLGRGGVITSNRFIWIWLHEFHAVSPMRAMLAKLISVSKMGSMRNILLPLQTAKVIFSSLSVCLSVCLSVRPSVRPPVRPAGRPAGRLSVCLSVCLSACLPACLPVDNMTGKRMKYYGYVGNDTRNKWKHFGHYHRDIGICFLFLGRIAYFHGTFRIGWASYKKQSVISWGYSRSASRSGIVYALQTKRGKCLRSHNASCCDWTVRISIAET